MRSRQDSKYDTVAFGYPYIKGKFSSCSVALRITLASQASAIFSLFLKGCFCLFFKFYIILYYFIPNYVRGTHEYRCPQS